MCSWQITHQEFVTSRSKQVSLNDLGLFTSPNLTWLLPRHLKLFSRLQPLNIIINIAPLPSLRNQIRSPQPTMVRIGVTESLRDQQIYKNITIIQLASIFIPS